jgi:hypothetical protein
VFTGEQPVPAVMLNAEVVNASLLAVIVNALLTADVTPVLAAVRFFDPVRSMLRLLNVARPEEFVAWVSVPLSVPVPVVSDSVMFTPEVVTLSLALSSNCTVTAGLIVAPDAAVVGCCTNTTFDAVILKALLTADVRPELAAVRFFDPKSLMLRLLNVARPEEFVFSLSVPLSVPVPVLSDSVMLTPELETLLPALSCNCTVTAGVIVAPDTVFVGCCTNTTFDTVNVTVAVGVMVTESVVSVAV